MKEDIMKVLFVKPLKKPEIIELQNDLTSMQNAVGGYIEQLMPYEDEVAIVCNEEGKMNGLPLNRAILDEDGEIQDIIAGNFFICYAPFDSENYLSMPDDLMEKYNNVFREPEEFIRTSKGIIVVPHEDSKEPLSFLVVSNCEFKDKGRQYKTSSIDAAIGIYDRMKEKEKGIILLAGEGEYCIYNEFTKDTGAKEVEEYINSEIHSKEIVTLQNKLGTYSNKNTRVNNKIQYER